MNKILGLGTAYTSAVEKRGRSMVISANLVSEMIDRIRALETYSPITMQALIDVGLNAFAVKLLAESVEQNSVTETVKFSYRQVGITIEPLPSPPLNEEER